ncbi:protease inhibitor I42 family protein [Nocardia arthritidis]|uniref:protease inhibitor I42 family protein n=1 Tax=Nocardia arthritidis TaxID=228602 RepID=UPI00142D608C|nr:protease inhibitor I42 family protein [Nocardia arthritidis]
MRTSLVVLLMGLALVACSSNSGKADTSSAKPVDQPGAAVTEKDNGQERQLKPGQQLTVTLPATPGTGYSWRIGQLDQNVVRQEGEPDYKPDPNVPAAPGSGGHSIWKFVANAAGVTNLTLDYTRPWEQGMEPAQKFTLTIKVE